METHPQSPFVGALTVKLTELNLPSGGVRAYVAQEAGDGVILGSVEAKRTTEEMQDSISVAARDAMSERQAREVAYPQAGGRS